jgi:hypothetical protein
MYGREERCMHVFGGETRGKETTWKTWCRWTGNIKMNFQGLGHGGLDWIDLARSKDRWRALMDMVMNIRLP